MSFYYQEKVAQNRMPFLAGLLLLAIAFLLAGGVAEASELSDDAKTAVKSLLLAGYGISAVKIMKSSARKYKYCLMQGELIIREMDQFRPRIQDRIHLNQIRSFKPMPLFSRIACIGEDDTCPGGRFWRLTYERDGRRKTRIIHPSNSLAEKIRQQTAA